MNQRPARLAERVNGATENSDRLWLMGWGVGAWWSGGIGGQWSSRPNEVPQGRRGEELGGGVGSGGDIGDH